ncbi:MULTISPECIES: acetyl-CoA carboxylase biotin carboxyl carrier protein [unclassified Sporosarcina]|uniref:acetyl-CoA carboxylase biotin carboxyl carrier protein n=1 Tax=unclassified Sporosarcina TaxID=2647733 RepID=UPI000C162D90|nr:MULTISPECIES: acetyl-CoA carboxylase biotin carboxyl carrier protein [unclassified Sporosarcina]PID00380.1 acetyl-CoA carboxylase, biotin carboxyl carrier protein [Sporosarcina sp. P29]PID06623.1 acetyl-CoA carboxylase, biotin carboxyl carrier protein [Sporosarcina sp. P30]PID09817.1 acetyl-CoA carboxylase, biotin carboxyl carrier protein [Sporosarcina sp. P31]PID13396.1 acetyl-CoA carboxylase, biotin carboxyl carrier protein [Sporosarcina sp. P32b]
MLKIQEIREIIKLIDQSSIQKFSLESDGGKIKLEKSGGQAVTTVTEAPQTPQAAPAPVQAPAAPVAVAAPTPTVAPEAPAAEVATDETLHKITSPMVGTYYQASSPDAEAFVKKGDKVTAESIVCIVEAMKLFNEIESEVNGEIVEILVQDGQLVEYGQPLFLVREN